MNKSWSVSIKITDNTNKKFICVLSGCEPKKQLGINKLFNKLQKHGNV